MTLAPLALYDRALAAHSGGDGCRCDTWSVRYADGRVRSLGLGRWCGEPDLVDRCVLERCTDPTLDIGCGPGRLVSALNTDGREALGVDIASGAVQLARAAGATVAQQSVFDPLPDEGAWGTALLIDGNIGIGGDPVALLRRCRQLLAADGITLVELDPPGEASSAMAVRLESHRRRSGWFSWANVAADEISTPAQQAGLRVIDAWSMDGRWFASLAR